MKNDIDDNDMKNDIDDNDMKPSKILLEFAPRSREEFTILREYIQDHGIYKIDDYGLLVHTIEPCDKENALEKSKCWVLECENEDALEDAARQRKSELAGRVGAYIVDFDDFSTYLQNYSNVEARWQSHHIGYQMIRVLLEDKIRVQSKDLDALKSTGRVSKDLISQFQSRGLGNEKSIRDHIKKAFEKSKK